MTDYVKVPRALWTSALADAIDWMESLVDAERNSPNPANVRRLNGYKRAYANLGVTPGPLTAALENASTVTLTEMKARAAEPADRPACPDGGTCHHGCAATESCFRVEWAGPLSGVFPGDRWPAEVRAAHTPSTGSL